MARGASESFAAARSHQRLALLDAARRRICDETRAWVAKRLGGCGALRHFEDALANRLFFVAFECKEEPARDASLGDAFGLHDFDPLRPRHRSEVLGRSLDLIVR